MGRIFAEEISEEGFMIRIKRKKANPTDHELLKEIEIVKKKGSIDKDFIFYNIFLNGKDIGGARVLKDTDYITDVHINKEYRLKGLATFLYNYIENDLKVKLQPSGGKELKGHSNLGKAFWQNRLKKQNPTDKEFLSKVKIQKVLNKEYISYEAFYNNKYIAGVDFDPKTKTIWDVWVGPNYRRKGLATFIYNKIEKDQKLKLKPSKTLFPDGQEFWKARLKTG